MINDLANYDRWLENDPYEELEERQERYDRWWDYMADLADLEHGDFWGD